MVPSNGNKIWLSSARHDAESALFVVGSCHSFLTSKVSALTSDLQMAGDILSETSRRNLPLLRLEEIRSGMSSAARRHFNAFNFLS